MKSFLMKWMLFALPKRTYTSLLGILVNTSWSAKMIPWYAKQFEIDESELAVPMNQHRTLGEFFSRKLSANARPICSGLVAPVDGTVSTMGKLDGEKLLQVKGKTYTLGAFLFDEVTAKQYAGGAYVTIYLSPRDYHRIHAPADCVATRCRHIPGTLFPVNEHGVHHIPRLFARNERVVTYFEAATGPFLMAKVGAAGVGTVVVPYGPCRSSRDRGRGSILDTHCHTSFAKGDEVGYFALGSTVVILFPPSCAIKWSVATGDKVRMGQTIAAVCRS